MVRDEFLSSACVSAVTVEELWAESRHPIDGRAMVMFRQEVHWLREISFEIVFMHGGQVVQDLGTFCSSTAPVQQAASAAIDLAKRRASYYGVYPTSSAQIVVIERAVETPVLLPRNAPARDPSLQSATDSQRPVLWRRFPIADWRRREVDPGSDVTCGRIDYLYPQLARGTVVERQIWSSQCTGQLYAQSPVVEGQDAGDVVDATTAMRKRIG